MNYSYYPLKNVFFQNIFETTKNHKTTRKLSIGEKNAPIRKSSEKSLKLLFKLRIMHLVDIFLLKIFMWVSKKNELFRNI